MSISERLSNYKHPRIGGTCRTCHILRTLPPDESAALQAALEDDRFSSASIAKILKAEGWNIADSTVRRHRSADCQP